MAHYLSIFILVLFSSAGWAKTNKTPKRFVSLSAELRQLQTEHNMAPRWISKEKLYSVQKRYVPLSNRIELSVGGAQNFNADDYIRSRQIDVGLRYYLSHRWYLGWTGSYVSNELSGAGERLIANHRIVPDSTYVKYRTDLLVGHHLFYGKFRISADQIFYFDQYIALGAGMVTLPTGDQLALVGDIGVVGWFGRQFSVRVGVKDYFYNEIRRLSSGTKHNLLGHVEFGFLF